jgi:tRNA(Ile)-lysidine synthase
MLMTTRAGVETYLASNGITHVEDSSNAKNDYARNRVRHDAIPVLASVNKGFTENAARAAALMREDEEFLESLASSFIKDNLTGEELSAEKLSGLPRPVASRVVRLLTGAACSEKHVDSVLSLALGEGLGYTDVPGMRVTREQGILRFGGEEPLAIEQREIRPEESTQINEAGMVITSKIIPNCPEINSSLNTFFFNYENICGIIFCTSRENGDRIKLAGRNCTKNLSDLFTERKMSRRQRLLTPVLRDEKGVVAVYGFGVAERCAAKPGATVLKIDIKKVGENT